MKKIEYLKHEIQIKMKSILTLGLLTITHLSMAQIGSVCDSAEIISTSNSCTFSNHTTTDTAYWLEFTATSPTISVTLKTEMYGVDVPHIHGLGLFSGTCGSLMLLEGDELPFQDDANLLNFDFIAPNLVVGQKYFLCAKRASSIQKCRHAQCGMNGSTNPTTFSICVEDISVTIPPDFDSEPPLISSAFEINRGQLIDTDGNTRPEIKLFNKRMNPAIFIAEDKVSYVFAKEGPGGEGDLQTQRMDLIFPGGNSSMNIYKTEFVSGVSNYYLPHIPEGVVGNRSYSRGIMSEIYPHIDMQHYSNSRGMKNYFVVNPEGNPHDIIMQFDGSINVSVGNQGELKVYSEIGMMQFNHPNFYQLDGNGSVVPMSWEGGYEIIGDDKVKFDIGEYDREIPFFIQMDQGHSAQPAQSIGNLNWCTYYGATGLDRIRDIDDNTGGNTDMYFTGDTDDMNFPSSNAIVSNTNVFVTRVVVGSHEEHGQRKWTTIYGATGDRGNAITTDDFGNVYITGFSIPFVGQASQFVEVMAPGAYQLSPSQSVLDVNYAFIAKYSKLTGLLTWATLLGEHTDEASFIGNAICTDEFGDVYVGGSGLRNTFPIVNNNGYTQSTSGLPTGFLMKFDKIDNSLEWSTMFGNEGTEILDMNTNDNNELFITGKTQGGSVGLFPLVAQQNVYQQNYSGGTDAFIARFSQNEVLEWSTFFGGADDDEAFGIDYNEVNDDVYITGKTRSDNTTFPLFDPGVQNVHFDDVNSFEEGFITAIGAVSNNPGVDLTYSSYFGGSGYSSCSRVRTSTNGATYVIGETASDDLSLGQLAGGYNQNTKADGINEQFKYDGFVLGLNPSNQVVWSTYFGGQILSQPQLNSYDDIRGLGIHEDDILYIGGFTDTEDDFPVTVDFNISPQAFIQYENSGVVGDTPASLIDGFIGQFNLIGTVLGTEELTSSIDEGDFEIIPNPTNDEFSISLSDFPINSAILTITNIAGQTVLTEDINLSQGSLVKTVSLGQNARGLYLVTISNGENSITKRVVLK